MTRKKPRALIVDDQLHVRAQIREIFEQAQIEVVAEACNGREAVERFALFRPELVTMDLVMPEMSGPDAARRILQEDPEALIIAVSGLSQPSVQAAAEDAGMRGFVPKPFERWELLAEVDALLHERG